MSTLIVDELSQLLGQPLSQATEKDRRAMVEDSGIVDYLDSVITEAAGVDDISLVVDVDGLKEVLDDFLPPLVDVPREHFVLWFDSLIAKRMSQKSATPSNDNEELLSDEASSSFLPRRNSQASVHQQLSSQQENNFVPNEETKEQQMKKQIIDKFSYVTEDEYQKEHRPHVVIDEEKKMTRFLNSKVVSTKGDRFAVEKAPESEAMKGTYVHIKQLRRFKFH